MNLVQWEREEQQKSEMTGLGSSEEPTLKPVRMEFSLGEPRIYADPTRIPDPSELITPRPTLRPREEGPETPQKSKKARSNSFRMEKSNRGSIVLLAVLLVCGFLFYSQCSLFIVPPTASMPQGATLIIKRLSNLDFVDSTDAFLMRYQGGVNAGNRTAVADQILGTAKIRARLPYVDLLYRYSTGGERFQ